MPNIPLGQSFVPNMSHWRFPQHRPSLVNQDITTVNNVAPNVQAHIAPSVTNFPQQIYSKTPLLIDMQSPSGTHQENPIATTSNIVPGLATPVFQPTYSYVGPTPLSWSGPQVSAPAPAIPDNDARKMTPCQNGNLLSIMAIHYNGTSGMVNSKSQLTRNR